MATTILTTTIFRDWLEAQPPQIQKQVTAVIELLRQYGVALPFPYSSAIVGAAFALRELRPSQWTKHLATLAAKKKPSKKGRRQ